MLQICYKDFEENEKEKKIILNTKNLNYELK